MDPTRRTWSARSGPPRRLPTAIPAANMKWVAAVGPHRCLRNVAHCPGTMSSGTPIALLRPSTRMAHLGHHSLIGQQADGPPRVWLQVVLQSTHDPAGRCSLPVVMSKIAILLRDLATSKIAILLRDLAT